jgi:bilin biosynthesis protein
MDNRFASFFNLSEAQAIAVLDTPYDQVGENDSRYIAASHLINYPSDGSIAALIRAVQNTTPVLDNLIVRRKSIETLGRLRATQALATISDCLQDGDTYTVENAAWAIGEIGTQDPQILEAVAQVLERPNQTYRVAIHTLTKLGYQPAQDRIAKFITDSDGPTASAALAGLGQLTGDRAYLARVLDFLQHPNVLARRLCIQDLADAKYYEALPHITYCPVSIVFRLRGVRLLADAGVAAGKLDFAAVQPHLETVLRDHPRDLRLVHSYSQPPEIDRLIRDLYDTDFGKCYLAIQTLLQDHPTAAPAALEQTYAEEAWSDYGAHFHVVKLWGWLRHAPAFEAIAAALNHPQPQFQKSRAAAAIALGEIGDVQAIPALEACLTSKIWDLKYAALLALERLGSPQSAAKAAADSDWLVRSKAASLLS